VNYEAPAVYSEHVISGILYLQRCEVLLQNMIISQRTSLVKSMIEAMKIPLDSYEDFLFVQERLAIYYSMLERSLLLSYGQHDIEWCQQFTAHQLSIIGNKPTTPLYKALYKTLMDVKRKADCEQPLATIDVLNRMFGYDSLLGTTEVSGYYNLFLREVKCARPTTSLSRKERKEGAVRVRLLCGRIILLRKESRLVHPSRLQPSCATHRICRQSTHSRLCGDPSIGRNINPCQENV
jgi:hypothetical protein